MISRSVTSAAPPRVGYKPAMHRTARVMALSLALAAPIVAAADPTPAKPTKGAKVVKPPAVLPKVGDALPLAGAPEWPTLSWMYEAPSTGDAGGKVIVHWFCGAKIAACTDDLARVIALRDIGRAYIVAYIAGGERDAKKLDPIRESEGVGRGTVAYGPNVATMMKQMGITGPASIVVDVDGKVAMVAIGGDATQLDARDQKVNALIGAIKEYTKSQDGPTTAKIGESFTLALKIQLASWLTYSKTSPSEFQLSVPKDIKCDKVALTGDQLKIDGNTLTAQVTCTATKGVYEARGTIRFGYESPGGGHGLGDDGTTWKFEIK